MAQTGITENTEKRIALGPGAIYRDYGEATEEVIGATLGGGTFEVVREDRVVELDGVKGPLKGLRRPVEHYATLTVTLKEMSLKTLEEATIGSSAGDGDHFTITPSNEIALGDYLDNIAFVGEVQNSDNPVVLKLLNALVDGGWSISVDGDDDEFGIDLVYSAHYDGATATTVPYEILWPEVAS